MAKLKLFSLAVWLRIALFRLAQMYSIGFKSGEYGGK